MEALEETRRDFVEMESLRAWLLNDIEENIASLRAFDTMSEKNALDRVPVSHCERGPVRAKLRGGPVREHGGDSVQLHQHHGEHAGIGARRQPVFSNDANDISPVPPRPAHARGQLHTSLGSAANINIGEA